MNPHRTNDPAKRAEHIANRLEREAIERPVSEWAQGWLDDHREVLAELIEANEDEA